MQKIAKRFVEVMRECSHVAKNGTNDFHRYKYATAADVLEKVNASLTKHGLASVVTPNLLSMQQVTTAKGNTEQLATVEVVVTLIDSESGETLTLKGLGSGQDAGDKAVAKAQTMALKYCYLNSLAIATSDDPEADQHTDEVMQQTPAQIKSKPANPTCNDCGANITQRVADYSKRRLNVNQPRTSVRGFFYFMEVSTMNNLQTLMRNNIWNAVDDYFRHTYSTEVLDDISEEFVNRLSDDAIESKRELRDLFRQSSGWNENLQAIVINGTKTHNPDYVLVHNLANSILTPAKHDADWRKIDLIDRAISFFSRPNNQPDSYIDAINELAPFAYAPRKKRSRIFKALCDSLGVTDLSAGSDFQKFFAQFADELSTRKIDFKLFVSINPAHFLTMSNPKDDERGTMLTSCHSFNYTDLQYNCGCSGYARDKYTFIVFTAADPDNPETLNNRKTSRQLFAYKPYNGLLLQSRLYNTNGGTCGNQSESKLYRDLIQRELSELEGVPNLWQTEKYCGNKHGVYFRKGEGFGGYCDWSHRDFNAKISIRADHAHDFQTFEIGTYGLCICCGDETSEGLYCSGCDSDEHEFCQECEERCRETFDVINSYGERIHVCANCLDEHYRFCERCEEYRPKDEFVDSVCRHCHELEEVSA